MDNLKALNELATKALTRAHSFNSQGDRESLLTLAGYVRGLFTAHPAGHNFVLQSEEYLDGLRRKSLSQILYSIEESVKLMNSHQSYSYEAKASPRWVNTLQDVIGL